MRYVVGFTIVLPSRLTAAVKDSALPSSNVAPAPSEIASCARIVPLKALVAANDGAVPTCQ
jgi:hypothetical protein